MVKVHFIEPDGNEVELDAMPGETVRDLAIDGGVEGILGECGGGAMCATCHVYVDEAWVGRLPPIESPEEAMLRNTASDRKPNSRLGCQIELAEPLDGIRLYVPEDQ